MIREVWAENLAEEIEIISDLLEEYPIIGMDTEFPGVIAQRADAFATPYDLEYQTMRLNVDLLKIIQLGITVGKGNGTTPPICTWQFNFKFDLNCDPYNASSIRLLQTSGGIDFDEFNRRGIEPYDFARLIIPSGLVMNKNVSWVTFHGLSDFGYLLKVLTMQPLPSTKEAFVDLLGLYFPSAYDIKNFTSATISLQRLANELRVERVGREHEAGSDSFVTLLVFCELKERILGANFASLKVENKIYGICPMCETPFVI